MTRYEFTVRYSEELVRNSAKGYFVHLLRRQLTWRAPVAFVLLIVLLFYAVSSGRSWLTGALGAITGFTLLFFYFIYQAHLKQALDRLHLMKEPVAIFSASDEALTVSSNDASSTIPWDHFANVLEYDDFWVLVLKQRAIFTLPLTGVDESALRFMRQQVSAHRSAG